jgi:hypothetical protein
MVSNEPSRKRGTEEVPPPPPAEPENVTPPPPAEPEEVPPPTPAEVKPLLPEEVKPPRRKVARQPVVPVRAPSVNVQDASWSVKLLHQAFVNLGKVAVHLGVQPPSHPLQTVVMDYAFKINILVGELERRVLPHLQRRRRRRWRPRRLRLRLRLRRWGSSGGDYLCLINLFLC